MGAKLSNNNTNSRPGFTVDANQGNLATAAGMNRMNGSRRDSRLRTRAVDVSNGANAYNEGTSSLPSDSSPNEFFNGAYSLPSRFYSLVHLSGKQAWLANPER
ncbi:uncharacterized protein TRIADDRAFT_55498 [Trichoplax adhaerens]|uniref:Uncharacterized protein n=1 Tax=Trichoplax adhaerens TaxID=10228 RepID=B3RV21_TRIAD|nr:predicted protein [Trichoplax adhaerens]EDV25421.1 predicted protein [Trichoplax adhaerens]|eukprot:XP_002111454.1 predicted protein [Trichoplax adhaerens]